MGLTIRLWRTFWGQPREIDRSRVFATCWHCGSAVPCHETWNEAGHLASKEERDARFAMLAAFGLLAALLFGVILNVIFC